MLGLLKLTCLLFVGQLLEVIAFTVEKHSCHSGVLLQNSAIASKGSDQWMVSLFYDPLAPKWGDELVLLQPQGTSCWQ